MNFAHTQKSSFTIVVQKSLLKSQIMNLESQKWQVLFFNLLLLLLKFDILKGTKIEGEPILGFWVLIKTNSKSKQNLNQFLKGQSLATKLIVALGYKLTQYLFIEGEFWQIYQWITSSSSILHVCKISRKLKINSYVINKFLNCKCNLKLCMKYKIIDYIVNNIRLTQKLTCVLRA